MIVGVQKNADQIKVVVKSSLHLLQRLKISGNTYNNTTVSNVVQSTGSVIASKTGYSVSFTCDIVESITNKEFRFGMSVYDVLKELAGNRYEFDLIWNGGDSYTLAFMQSIGEDKTTGSGAIDYRYDIADLSDANMDYTCTIDFMELANTIYARSGNATTTQSDASAIISY